MKLTKILILAAVLGFSALTIEAKAWNNWPQPQPNNWNQPGWWYNGQRQAPNHGTPPGINYCGTENPGGSCQYWQRGQECYVNNGYWWDNNNHVNWFNVYQCR